MDVGEVRVAEDKDFEKFKSLVESSQDGWKSEYDKGNTKVWSKFTEQTDFKMIKVRAIYNNVKPSVLYDVLFDPDFRKTWDTYMTESYDIAYICPNNDVGYYAVQSPPPLKSRDFVLQRSWRATAKDFCIINHSVFLESHPPKPGYIRATSYLTGFLIKPLSPDGCEMGYVSQCDPKGSLPTWLVNKCAQIFAPKVAKNLYTACLKYESWKSTHNPDWKPWLAPSQTNLPRICLTEVLSKELRKSRESLEDFDIEESK